MAVCEQTSNDGSMHVYTVAISTLETKKKYAIHQIWGGLLTLIHHNIIFILFLVVNISNITAVCVTECKKLLDSSLCQLLNNVHGVTIYII